MTQQLNMRFLFSLFVSSLLFAFGGNKMSAADMREAPSAAELSFAKDVRPVLEQHCLKCHGASKPRGGVNLARLTDSRSVDQQRKLWRRVVEQIDAREMPPEGRPPLPDNQREALSRWIKQTLEKSAAVDPLQRDAGPALIRRLNRSEYNRTLRDLFGINFDAASAVGMPADAVGEAFDNLASALNLAPALLEKYFAAAEQVLDQLTTNRKAHDALFFVKPGKDVSRHEAARQVLVRFARRAYRRPLTEGEAERLMKLFEQADAKGERFEDALRFPLKAVLVSPYFLFRIEEDRSPEGAARSCRISAHELAVRLSYFLWSSMPDEELARLADEGKLADATVLEQQVRRMLKDARARALTEDFAAQWLQIRKLPEARPSREFFPTFTPGLRQAMYDEAATFFDRLRGEDRSILHLLDADYTYLNEELAKHYGITGVKGQQLREVKLKPEDHRGGLLSMGSMLALTSHTSRTSPTLRGKWVLEVIFGTPPDPPPPDAGMLKEDHKPGEEPKSFREQMAQHARRPSCASCHKKIDPLGFALENFDAVGRWRDSVGDRPVDNAAQLVSGEKFAGPQGLKQVVLRRQNEFVHNLAERMLMYALGRELHYYDESSVREATAALKQGEHRFSALVLAIVRSFPFQHRRARGINDE